MFNMRVCVYVRTCVCGCIVVEERVQKRAERKLFLDVLVNGGLMPGTAKSLYVLYILVVHLVRWCG